MTVYTFMRHGDLLIEPTQKESKEILQKKEDNCVLDGEVSGHHHRVGQEGTVAVCEPTIANGYFRGIIDIPVKKKTTITHEEHAPIELGEGKYDCWVQREYDPIQERRVLD